MASALRPSLSTAQRRLQLLIPKACNRLNNNPLWHSFTNLSPPLASHRKNYLLQLLRRYHQSPPRRKEVPPSVENTHALVTDSKSPVLPPLPSPPVSSISGESPASPSFAFAFDIDGVLLHSRTAHPPAIPTLHHLQNTSVPFLLLTNGGGSLERIRAENLSKYLNLTSPPLSPSHIIQSHTPFKHIAAQQKLPASFDPYVPGGRELKNAVLVVGGPANGSCRTVAQEYGFRNVIIPEDIFLEWARDTTSGSSDTSKTTKPTGHEEGGGKGKISSSVWPFRQDNPDFLYKLAQPLPRLPDGSIMPIDAIFVFNDPRDWGRDIQIILDFILPAVESDSNSSSTISSLQPPPPVLVFSNPDLIWSSLHPTPRLGQGAFRAALEGTYRRVVEGTRPDLSPVMKYVCIGKPFQETYQYAEEELMKAVDSVNNRLKLSQEQEQKESKEQQGSEYEGNPSSQPKQNQSSLKTVYMLGDNPLSDIQGANAFNQNSTRGIEWVSILVESGVYKRGQDFPAGGKPRMIVKDVWEGVRWALKREGWV